jgi:hypothetical protein
MIIKLRCNSLNFIAIYSKAMDAFPAEESAFSERDTSDVARVGSSTKLRVSSSKSKAIL